MLTGEGLKKAVEFFQLAISKDSSYASAYAGMADAYGLLAFFAYLPTNETLRKGEEAANKALQLDNTIAEAHASLGLVSLFDWKWPVAERELRRAIELLGERDKAFFWLEKARDEHLIPFYIKVQPAFDSLRSDPATPTCCAGWDCRSELFLSTGKVGKPTPASSS